MHVRDQLYIDGKWVDTTRKGSIDVINPATEQIIGKVPVGSTKDVDKAVAQVLQMVNEGTVTSLSGKKIPIVAETVCIHGDGELALLSVKRIRDVLRAHTLLETK